MGMSFFSKSSEDCPQPAPLLRGNPDPRNFEILSCHRCGDLWVSRVRYPDCDNFEGEKILVTNEDPTLRTTLDPHFTTDGYVVARFAPTHLGALHARRFVLGELAVKSKESF